MKRLVSVLYADFHPFEHLPNISECVCLSNPNDLREGDIIIVHGGSDIHPKLYNKGRSSKSGAYGDTPSKRDMIEWDMMRRATELDIPIIGICRGAQMLCALAGGTLIQHVNGHGGWHEVELYNGTFIDVNSIHHQMMNPAGTDHELVAWMPQPLSDVYFDVDEKVDIAIEPEFIYFPKQKGFAIQWHPEMMERHEEANAFVLDYVQKRL